MRVRPGITGSIHLKEKIGPFQIKAFANQSLNVFPLLKFKLKLI